MSRTTALSHLSVTDLRREIRARQRRLGTLERRRARIARQLAAVDAQIAAAGGSAGHNGRRARNEVTLADALARALKGRTMSVADAAAAVRRAGYRSAAANFRTAVNVALLNKKRFKRVGRGRYRAV